MNKLFFLFFLFVTGLISCNSEQPSFGDSPLFISHILSEKEGIEIAIRGAISRLEKAQMYDELAARPFYDKALASNQRSNRLCEYIDWYKIQNGVPIDSLLSKIYDYQCDLLIYASSDDRDFLRDSLFFSLDFDRSSLQALQEKVPTESYLNLIKNDVRTAELHLINALSDRYRKFYYLYDTLQVRVIPKSNVVKKGEDYRAELVLAAASTTMNPYFYIGKYVPSKGIFDGAVDSVSIKVVEGKGYYTVKPSGFGNIETDAAVRIKHPSKNEWQYLPFKIQYTVIQ